MTHLIAVSNNVMILVELHRLWLDHKIWKNIQGVWNIEKSPKLFGWNLKGEIKASVLCKSVQI